MSFSRYTCNVPGILNGPQQNTALPVRSSCFVATVAIESTVRHGSEPRTAGSNQTLYAENGWTIQLSVYSTNDTSEAEILRNALQDEGLKCEISGKKQAGFTGIGSLEIQLLVRAEDFDRARDFLERHHHGG